MKRDRITLFIALGLVGLDLLSVLARAAILDFYLRPLALLAILVHGVFLEPEHARSRLFVLIGLGMAVITEGVQRLEFPGQWSVVATATALYYVMYTTAFALRQGGGFAPRALLPFGGIGLYLLAMFFWLQPYGLIREPSFLYIAVTAVMVGFGLRPYWSGARDTMSRELAIGVLLLVFSDTLRVITLLKMGEDRGTYLLDFLMEALILAPFFAGHFLVVRSGRKGV